MSSYVKLRSARSEPWAAVALLELGSGLTSNFATPMTQEQIADAIGLIGVHVNRTMRGFRDDGLIVTSTRTMTLPDVARLRRIAGFDPSHLNLALSDETSSIRSVTEVLLTVTSAVPRILCPANCRREPKI